MQWRESAGVRWLEADLGRARAAFGSRLGGVSEPPFDALNLGILTDDDPAAVATNRRRLAAALGLEAERIPVGLQVHGAELLFHTAPQRPSPFAEPGAGELPQADGHVVSAPGLAPLVLQRRLPAGRARRPRRRGDPSLRLARTRRRDRRRRRRGGRSERGRDRPRDRALLL